MSESARRQGAIGPGRTGEVVDFQDAGDKRVETTGDFSLTPEEVNSVLITLREHGIDATTLHSHTWTTAGNQNTAFTRCPRAAFRGYFQPGIVFNAREG